MSSNRRGHEFIWACRRWGGVTVPNNGNIPFPLLPTIVPLLPALETAWWHLRCTAYICREPCVRVHCARCELPLCQRRRCGCAFARVWTLRSEQRAAPGWGGGGARDLMPFSQRRISVHAQWRSKKGRHDTGSGAEKAKELIELFKSPRAFTKRT